MTNTVFMFNAVILQQIILDDFTVFLNIKKNILNVMQWRKYLIWFLWHNCKNVIT